MATVNLQETPCFVVFDFLKKEANINYKDFAMRLFNKQAKLGKVPLLNRLEDKTYLSRQVVRLQPGVMSLKMFDDFSQTATFAWNSLKEAAGEGKSNEVKAEAAYEKLIDHAIPQMMDVLKAFDLKGKSFFNVAVTITSMQQLNVGTKGCLIMMLFIISGCTGDVPFAIDTTIEQMNMQGAVMRTARLSTSLSDEDDEAEEEESLCLTLFRIKNGLMVTPGYPLSESEEGTEIGLLPSGSHAIADVERTVSRHHLNIRKCEDGKWRARGLNSKNGTVKVEAGTNNEVVVEYPRDFAQGAQMPEVEIAPGDHLILGQDTEFVVCRTLSS